MKRVVSGIKPSGEVTLGNYLGAMKRWADLQRDETKEYFYFVPNLHAITVRQDPKELANNTLSAVAWLLALGVDPKRATVFVQSQVPAHAEMGWILNNYVTMGELSRMTQFKDKGQRVGPEGQLVGLFDYPVLMAADILLYDTDEVPVGEDQKQHVELARDIANRFNNLYGETFKVPQATLQETGARIMDLQNPVKKMSKSDDDASGVILLTDTPGNIEAKIKKAVTDSGSEIKQDMAKPAVSNLLTIYALLAKKSVEELERDYEGKGYGQFKSDLAELTVNVISSLQKSHQSIMADKDALLSIVLEGRDRAAVIAEGKLAQVKGKIGLL